MPAQIRHKWRPSLVLVLDGALVAMVAMQVIDIALIRYLMGIMDLVPALLLVALATGSMTLMLGFVLWRLLLRPIRLLSERTADITMNQTMPVEPLDHYGTRELGQLGQAVLEMADTLQDRAAATRSFTDHVIHELKSPLTAIQGSAELLQETARLSDEDLSLLQDIVKESRRMNDQLQVLRKVAAAREPTHRGETRLEDLSSGLVSEFPGLTLTIRGEAMPIPLSAGGMQIVLEQLISNAQAHGATEVKITAWNGPCSVFLTVSDNGRGIPEAARNRIFEPFFSTRGKSGGTGMGLNIVLGLLRAHRGDLEVLDPPSGASFRISFPR